MFFDVCLLARRRHPWFHAYLDGHDFAANSRRAVVQRPAEVRRLVLRGQCRTVPGCQGDDQGRDRFQGSSSAGARAGRGDGQSGLGHACAGSSAGWLNRALSQSTPPRPVKELRRQQLAPKGLDRSQVRRLLREIELRQDVRAGAIFSLFSIHRLPVSAIWWPWNCTT